MGWLQNINSNKELVKEGLYRILVPPVLFDKFQINPIDFRNFHGVKQMRLYAQPGDKTSLIEIKLDPSDKDPVYSLQIADTVDRIKINLDFIIINDPNAPRFDTDIDNEGRDTLFGTAGRNIDAEVAAMEAGLFPGQVRKGLGMGREFMECFKHFCRMFGVRTISLEALFYHNAISYEQMGFTYFQGFKRMKRINDLFGPEGKLTKFLNGSTPFRQPGFEKTLLGRSWAVHDGILDELENDPILDEPWHSPEMYLMVDKPRPSITFPDPIFKPTPKQPE